MNVKMHKTVHCGLFIFFQILNVPIQRPLSLSGREMNVCLRQEKWKKYVIFYFVYFFITILNAA